MEELKDKKAAWEALQDDDTLRKIAIERLIEGFYDLEKEVKNFPKKVEEASVVHIQNLKNDLDNIKQAINDIPDSVDSKTTELRNAAVALHDEFQQSKGEVKGSIEEARNNATVRLYEAVSDVSEAAKKVIDAANKAVDDIKNNADTVINTTLKTSLDNYDGKTTDITKKLDNAIRNAFDKSTKKFMTICGIALFFSTVLQLGMWGWFVYMLTR